MNITRKHHLFTISPRVRGPVLGRHRTSASLALGVLVAGSVLAVAGPANAAPAEGGVLWVHGAGSVFTGPNQIMTSVTTAGGVATYTLEVVNEGPVTGQFNLRLTDDGGGETEALASGTLITTPLAESDNGYYTAPIAPGKNQVFTLRVTTPKTATQTSLLNTNVTLYDTAGTELNNEALFTEVRSTTGSTAVDTYGTTAGSQTVVAEAGTLAATTAEAVKPAAKAVFTVKVQNDGTETTQDLLQLANDPASDCPAAGDPTLVVTEGTGNVTAALLDGSFDMPVLAHGKSVTFTFTVTYPAGAGCENLYALETENPSVTGSQIVLITNPAAVL